jgi:hypothetical protein
MSAVQQAVLANFKAGSSATPTVEYLVIGGGTGAYNGGGAAGQFRTAAGYSVTAGSPITVTVGAGGNVAAGTSSVFGSITSTSGTMPAGTNGAATSGNSYAGGNFAIDPCTSNAGYGGGGGSSAVGADGSYSFGGGAGGAGTSSSISGSSVTYAGGGGGGANVGSAGLGAAGGGNGGLNVVGSNATTNSGSGGGGDGSGGASGGLGGSGIVIIRYSNTYPAATSTTGSPTISNTGGYRIYKWTGSGSITF